MDDARRLITEGDTTTNIILADEQTAGRGRHNRPWITFPAPYGMAATFIFRPAVGPHLPLIVAIALHQALTQITNNQSPIAIKWPNDMLLGGKKLSGILCENLGTGASIIGIGLNIQAPEDVPASFVGTFLGAQISPETLAHTIMACLNPLVALYQSEGWSTSLHTSYLQHCATIGQTIRWRVPPKGENPAGNSAEIQELTGLVRGLTPNGHLELVDDNGTVHVIHSGEIFDKRPS